ncbi:unnamed protein product [Rhizopus stolonifer]
MSEQHSAKDLGKNKLTLSAVRPLSVLIPPSWSSSTLQQPSSQTPSQLSALSLDQLSLYAKKISNATLYPFNTSSSSSSTSSIKQNKDTEQRKKALRMKIDQASNGFLRIVLLSLNDRSLKFYTVSEHIQRKVPRLVESKKKMRQLSEKVETANLDIEDAQKSIRDMEQTDSFLNISNMIKSCIELIKRE